MIEYNYNKDEDIIYVKRQGEISFDDLMEYVHNIYNDFQTHNRIFVLTQTIETELIFNPKDYPILINEIRKHLDSIDVYRDAIVISKSLNVAYSVIFEKLSIEIQNYSYKTFSIKEAAKEWLLKEQGYL